MHRRPPGLPVLAPPFPSRPSFGSTGQQVGIWAVGRKFARFDFVQIAASGSASGEDACVRALARIHCEHEAKHDDSHGGSHQNRPGEAGFAAKAALQRICFQSYTEDNCRSGSSHVRKKSVRASETWWVPCILIKTTITT